MKFVNALPVWSKKYDGDRNILLEFVTKLNFEGKKTEMTVAADALYRVLVNGAFVAQGPQRCGRGTWRYEELDITDKLANGENEITVQVLSHGVRSFEYIMQPGFLQAEIFVDGISTVYTSTENGGFSCKRNLSKEQVVERYSFQRPFIEVWHLPMQYEEITELIKRDNIKLLPRTAMIPNFDVLYPEKVLNYGTADIPENYDDETNECNTESSKEYDYSYKKEQFSHLYRCIMKHIKVTELIEDGSACDKDYSFSIGEGQWKTLKFPYEDTGFVSFDVECDENSVLYYTYEEVLTENDCDPGTHFVGTCNIVPLYLEKGKHNHLALEPRSLQYIKFLCQSGKVKISNVSMIEYVNPNRNTAKFTCDDEALNRVYKAAVNTFVQNSVDLFMDCPSRERAGWLCDSFFTGRSEKDLTGGSAVEKAFLENFFIASRFTDIADGMLPMCYPSEELSGTFIPNWAMFLVIELEEYVKRTNDKAMIELAKERLYKLEDYFCKFINSDGLLEKLQSWVFVEWSQANKWTQDVNFPSNMMYYAMLKSMARMYNDKALDEKAEKIKAKINELSYNGKFFRDHQVYVDGKLTTPEDITEVCQYYAFFTGVADKERYPELLRIIADDFGAGHKCERTQPGVYPANAFIGNYLRMEVLSFNGYRKQIINEIKEYFDYMALKTGTLWENDSTHASCNHGFSSHAVRFIFRDCLGVEKIDENTKTVTLNNDSTAPKNAHAEIPLKNGTLIIDIVDSVRTAKVVGDYKIV